MIFDNIIVLMYFFYHISIFGRMSEETPKYDIIKECPTYQLRWYGPILLVKTCGDDSSAFR